MKIKLAIMAATVVSVFSVSATAATVFSDNFDTDALALNQTIFRAYSEIQRSDMRCQVRIPV